MELPTKMQVMLDEESPEFRRLFRYAHQQLEKLKLSFRPHQRKMVVARHPNHVIDINCVAMEIVGKHKGDRRLSVDFRVDSLLVDNLFTRPPIELRLHKYDKDDKKRPVKALWCQVRIESRADVKTVCTIAKSVIASTPSWGRRKVASVKT